MEGAICACLFQHGLRLVAIGRDKTVAHFVEHRVSVLQHNLVAGIVVVLCLFLRGAVVSGNSFGESDGSRRTTGGSVQPPLPGLQRRVLQAPPGGNGAEQTR